VLGVTTSTPVFTTFVAASTSAPNIPINVSFSMMKVATLVLLTS
jgi:hypothetical protein